MNDRGGEKEDKPVDRYRNLLQESAQLICQFDARDNTCVFYALAMLSICHSAAAGNFLNYIFG